MAVLGLGLDSVWLEAVTLQAVATAKAEAGFSLNPNHFNQSYNGNRTVKVAAGHSPTRSSGTIFK